MERKCDNFKSGLDSAVAEDMKVLWVGFILNADFTDYTDFWVKYNY